jgi:hypothetical protein
MYAASASDRGLAAYVMSVRESVPGLVTGNAALVEAGGQFTRGFRCGLDYAFILAHTVAGLRVDAERVIQLVTQLDPSARPARTAFRRVYESLQGGPEVGPLSTPRRCHATVLRRRRRIHRCELRCHSTLAG